MKGNRKRITAAISAFALAVIVAAAWCMPQQADAAKKTLKGTNVTLSKASYTYNAKIQKPTVKVKYNKKTLKSGKDYTATYTNKSSRNAGTYKVTVKGKGKYKGTVTKAYKINPMSIISSNGKTASYPGDVGKHGKFELYYPTVHFSSVYRTNHTPCCCIGGTLKLLKNSIKVIRVTDGSCDAFTTLTSKDYSVISGPSFTKSNWSKSGNVTMSMKVKGKGNYKGTATVYGNYYLWPKKCAVLAIDKTGTDVEIVYEKRTEGINNGCVWIHRQGTKAYEGEYYDLMPPENNGDPNDYAVIPVGGWKAGTYEVRVGYSYNYENGNFGAMKTFVIK